MGKLYFLEIIFEGAIENQIWENFMKIKNGGIWFNKITFY